MPDKVLRGWARVWVWSLLGHCVKAGASAPSHGHCSSARQGRSSGAVPSADALQGPCGRWERKRGAGMHGRHRPCLPVSCWHTWCFLILLHRREMVLGALAASATSAGNPAPRYQFEHWMSSGFLAWALILSSHSLHLQQDPVSGYLMTVNHHVCGAGHSHKPQQTCYSARSSVGCGCSLHIVLALQSCMGWAGSLVPEGEGHLLDRMHHLPSGAVGGDGWGGCGHFITLCGTGWCFCYPCPGPVW